MQHQFKPGDLALIIRADKTPDNVGRVVEVVEVEFPAYDKWPVRIFASGLSCYVDGESQLRTSDRAWVNPNNLMPLKGTETPQLEKQKEVENGFLS